MNKKTLSFNDAVKKKTEAFEASAAHSAQLVGKTVVGIHEKTMGVKNGVKAGLHDVKQDVHHAAKTISE